MLVEMLRKKQEDLVVMHFHRSVWHLPLPSNSRHAPCVESGRARMGWEVDAGSCADCHSASRCRVWALDSCLLSFMMQKAVGFLARFLHVSGREGAGSGTVLLFCCKLCQHEPRKNGQWVFSRIIES